MKSIPPKTRVPRKISQTLLGNCHSFLEEALRRALDAEKNPDEWKFATFSLCQAVELSLKERLAREHPALLHANVDKDDRRTISLEQAVGRLCLHCGLRVSDADHRRIRSVALWRNAIVHSDFELNVTQLKAAFASMLGFLVEFHESALDENLASEIGEPLWSKAVAIRQYGRKLYDSASKRLAANKVDPDSVFPCAKCGYDALAVGEDYCRCYVCGDTEDYVECIGCHKLVPRSLAIRGLDGDDEDACYYHVCERCLSEVASVFGGPVLPVPRRRDGLRGVKNEGKGNAGRIPPAHLT